MTEKYIIQNPCMLCKKIRKQNGMFCDYCNEIREKLYTNSTSILPCITCYKEMINDDKVCEKCQSPLCESCREKFCEKHSTYFHSWGIPNDGCDGDSGPHIWLCHMCREEENDGNTFGISDRITSRAEYSMYLIKTIQQNFKQK